MIAQQKFPFQQILYSFKCGLSSFVATSISVSILHPFQIIKVRFQSHDGQANSQNIVPKYRNISHALKEIITDQGVFGIFKGLSVTVLSAAISSSLFFTFYQKRKKSLNKNDQPNQSMDLIVRASIEAGIAVICITQPLWVIKTRMLLNTQKSIRQSSNILSTIRQVYNQYGLKGFYKGFSVNLFLSSNRALQMFFYEGSRKLYDSLRIPQSDLMEKNFICGGISKIGNVMFIYPFTTIRTRTIQNQFIKKDAKQQKYNNIRDIIMKTMKKEGLRGFYKGITANLIRGIPQRSIFFYSYEMLKSMLISDQRH